MAWAGFLCEPPSPLADCGSGLSTAATSVGHDLLAYQICCRALYGQSKRVWERDPDVSRPQEHSQSHGPFLLPVKTDSDWQEKPTQLEWSLMLDHHRWLKVQGNYPLRLSFLFECRMRKWLTAKICKNKRLKKRINFNKVWRSLSESKLYDNSFTI